MRLGIGTPPQLLTLTVLLGNDFYDDNGIHVASAVCDECPTSHYFRENESSTFRSTGLQTEKIGSTVIYIAESGSDQVEVRSVKQSINIRETLPVPQSNIRPENPQILQRCFSLYDDRGSVGGGKVGEPDESLQSATV